MKSKSTNSKNTFSKPVTLKELGEFTDKIILPGVEVIVNKAVEEKIEGIIDAKIGPMRQDIKTGFEGVSRSIRALAGEVVELKVR